MPDHRPSARGVRAARWITGLALALLPLVVACSTPIGVTHVGASKVYETFAKSVLTGSEPSIASIQVLNREFLRERYAKDPAAALQTLHERYCATRDDALLFALAELSLQQAERERSRGRFLLAAAYAYAFLVPEESERTSLVEFDPRFRLAADLYNRALTEGMRSEDGTRVVLKGGSFSLPVGSVTVTRENESFRWGGFWLVDFVPVGEYQVRGLRNQYRRPGLGAPLAAALRPDESASPLRRRWIPPRLRVPVTALLEIASPRQALVEGDLHATLQVYAADSVGSVEIAGRKVPLEYEPTSAMAYQLEGSPIWSFELRGFFLSDLNPFPRSLDTADVPGNGLFMLQPYRPGLIPLVLVHGTASSAARWAEMVNELNADARIRHHYQIWLFTYNTGNPIAYSGALLREALEHAISELDPQGRDPALRRIVVTGHSQGGLLAKLTVVDSGDVFWKLISDVPLQKLDLQRSTRELFRRVLFFHHVQAVKGVIFISTPHHGSFLARHRIGRIVSYFVTRPTALMEGARDLIDHNQDRILQRSLDRVPSSIDNMDPSNPFLRTLAALPIAPGVSAHSIIPVLTEPYQDADDGVVAYKSAHLDGVPETIIYPSGHSTQSHPETIAEVRRILLEALEKP